MLVAVWQATPDGKCLSALLLYRELSARDAIPATSLFMGSDDEDDNDEEYTNRRSSLMVRDHRTMRLTDMQTDKHADR
jgi:hypothetical protein